MARGLALVAPGLAVALALVLAAPAGSARADGAKPFDLQNGVRVYRGPDFTTSFEPAPAPRPAEPAAPTERGPAATLDPLVEIPDQLPIARAGYRLRCPVAGSTSCALSQVVVDLPNQPLVQHSGFRPGTLVRFGAVIRDGALVPVVRVIHRGVRVHRAGVRDDLRILVHRSGTREGGAIKVGRAGVRDDRNIRVHRAGIRNDANIKVHRSGIRSGANIKVHGHPRAGG